MAPDNRSVTTSPAAPGRGREEVLKDAVDRIFAEFELLFPLQFKSAYDSQEKLNSAKQVWYQVLKERRLDPVLLVHAARDAAADSKYLPTVQEVLQRHEERYRPPPPLPLPAEKPLKREKILQAIAAARRLLKK